MSDIGEDGDAAWAMVCAAQDRLIKKEGEKAKDHELLSYLYLKFRRDREYVWQELLKRYSRDPMQKGNVKGAMECTYALARYLIALEVALGERTAHPQTLRDGEAELPQSRFDDEIPF